MRYHPLPCFSFFDGPAASKSGPLLHGQGKNTTTNIFREIIFNTVRWKRQYTAAGLFQLFCGISTQFFLTHFLLFWRFTQKFSFQFSKIVSHTLCYKSFEKICTKQLWSKKSTKNWQICQLLWENPQKNLFL